MKIDIFDTYVTHLDGKTMHFDVLLPPNSTSEKAICDEVAEGDRYSIG